MTTHLVRAALLVLGLVLGAGPALAKDAPGDEAKLRTAAAAEVAKVAAACAAAGAKTEAARLAAEAASLDPEAPGVADAKEQAEALDGDAEGADAAVQKAKSGARAAVAKAYDKLAALDHAPADAGRFAEYLVRAVAWEPKPRAAKAAKKAASDLDSATPWHAARLLARLRAADPDGAKKGVYDAGEADLGKSSKLMLASAVNDYVCWVSLPRDWKKGGTYPVLVGCEGAGCNFQGYLASFVSARGSRNVIVVTPVSPSSTNADALNTTKFPMYGAAFLDACKTDLGKRMELEGPGLDSVLADLRARFGAEERAFHTGFSGGGIFTYWRLFQAPDKVRGAAPCCANFGGLGLQDAPAAKDGGPPVHLFVGEKDQHNDHVFGQKPGLLGQTDLAQENLAKNGFANVRRTTVPGAGHSSLPQQVWEFVDEVLAGKAK